MLNQVMTESWELGIDELIKKRGFIYCNPGSSPTLTGFLVQSILTFLSNLVLFQEVSPSASTEPVSRCSLALGAEGKPTAVGLGKGIHRDSPTLAAQPPRVGFVPPGFPVIHNLIRSGFALPPLHSLPRFWWPEQPKAEPSPAQMVNRAC